MAPLLPALATIGSAVGGAAATAGHAIMGGLSAAGGALAHAGGMAMSGLTTVGKTVMSGMSGIGGSLLKVGQNVGTWGAKTLPGVGKNLLNIGKTAGKFMMSDKGKAIGKGLTTIAGVGMTASGLISSSNQAKDAAASQASFTASQSKAAADAEATTIKTNKDYLGRSNAWAADVASSSTSLVNNITGGNATKSLLITKLK